MSAVLLVVAVTGAWLWLLGWFYVRGTAHNRPVTIPGPRDPDDVPLAAGLGVSEAGYSRYVERGLDQLAGYLRAGAVPADDPATDDPRAP